MNDDKEKRDECKVTQTFLRATEIYAAALS